MRAPLERDAVPDARAPLDAADRARCSRTLLSSRVRVAALPRRALRPNFPLRAFN
jgi:hypothetical protein